MKLQRQPWFQFAAQVLTVLAVVVVTPIAVVASIPVICFMAPMGLMALPFMLGSFFGQSKEARPARQPLRKLQPQVSH